MLPCFTLLSLHLQRANYIAKIWNLTSRTSLTLPDISNYDWNKDGRMKWIQQLFP